jgi:light-regulated signal transduction histidine kinase (bacteriophytochrome)
MNLSSSQRGQADDIAALRHRLRTPLNHIVGYSEMLLEEFGSSGSDEVTLQLRAVYDLAQSLVLTIQETLSPQGRNAEDGDVLQFRTDVTAALTKLGRLAGEIVALVPAQHVLDALRIAGAAAELLDFAHTESYAQDANPQSRAPSVPSVAVEAKASILIVDDDEANRDILYRQLVRIGYSVSAAKGGEEALSTLGSEHFDIVLVDYMMPGMDGLAVLEALKSSPATRDIPVLMISALDDLTGVSRCIEHGADDYLFKPFERVLLSARISAALERSRLRAQERQRTSELEYMSQELQRSNEELKRFAYAASHDLQAPLRTITTHLQLLERHIGGQLPEEDIDLLRYPVDAALRMSHLIKDLLVYSQVSTEERVVTPVSCEETLSSTLADIASLVAENAATVTHDPLPTVMADAVQIRQLFSNLVVNGIKYRRDDLPPCIRIAARRESHGWHFAVTDNGVGIPPEHLDDIFNLFKRLHGAERPGTGLGLSICKRIVERLGGRIWVRSEVGSGSTFHFTIPDETPAAKLVAPKPEAQQTA